VNITLYQSYLEWNKYKAAELLLYTVYENSLEGNDPERDKF